MTQHSRDLSRRRLLFGGAAVGAGALLAACTSNEHHGRPAPQTKAADNAAAATPRPARRSPSASPPRPPTTAGSPPSPTTPRRRPRAYSDVEFKAVDGRRGRGGPARRAVHADRAEAGRHRAAAARRQGAQRRSACEAMKAGIPVVNLDRAFPDALAYRLPDQGRQLRHGRRRRATTSASSSRPRASANPVIGEIAGIDELELTQERVEGLRGRPGRRTASRSRNRRAAEFTVDSGQQEAAQLLQALPKIDAIWNHDDDQGIGVLAAIKQANRKEFFMVGGAGSQARDGRTSRPTTRC